MPEKPTEKYSATPRLDLQQDPEEQKKLEKESGKKKPHPQDPPPEETEEELKKALETVPDEKTDSPKEEQTAKPQEEKPWYQRAGGFLAQQGQELLNSGKRWLNNLLGNAITQESAEAPKTIQEQLKSATAHVDSQSLAPKSGAEATRDDIIAHRESQIGELLKKGETSRYKGEISELFSESLSFDLKEFLAQNSNITAFIESYDVNDEDQSKKWEEINPQIAELIKSFTANGSPYAEKLKQLKITHLDVEIKVALGRKAVQLIIAEIVEKKKGEAKQIHACHRQAEIAVLKIDPDKISANAEQASADVARSLPQESEEKVRETAKQSAEEIYIKLQKEVIGYSAKVKQIQERYKLGDEDISIDENDGASWKALQERKNLKNEDIVLIKLALKQFQLAQIALEDQTQIQKQIQARTIAVLQGKSEIEMAKVEDALNYEAYKESYDTIDQYAKAYEYLTQENKQALTQEQVLIIVKTVEGEAKANEFSETVQSLEQSGAHISNLHYANGQIQGELSTDWGVKREFGYSAEKGTIQIPDPNADLKYHEILPSSENFKQVILLINVDQAMFEASKERSQQEMSETRISDQELLNLSSQIKFNLLTNERERINFFSNFLGLIRDNNEDQNNAIYRGVDRKLFTLQRILIDPSKNRQFTNLIKLEDYRQFKPQSFTEYMRFYDLLPN